MGLNPAFTIAISLCLLLHLARGEQYCKPQLGDLDWPHREHWKALNASVTGHLHTPTPPGAVCHRGCSQYNIDACDQVQSQWTNTSFHALNPESVDYNDDTCLPNATAPCTTGGYPRYVIDAHNATDVAQGVKFAAKTGVRLIVKATGHDYPGRSSGTESLSIYTRNIRGMKVVSRKEPAGPIAPAATIKIHAGHQFRDIYRFAADKDLTIIGGADPDVGIGGWMSGGGHGPLTALYGMGADQVVEMEVVTPDGELRTVNADQRPDLFWAIRGAGGSVFGVIISFTIRAYPPISTTITTLAFNTSADSDAFWSAAANFHAEMPRLGDAGVMGYYQLNPRNLEEPNASIAGQFGATLLTPRQSRQQTKKLLNPVMKAINESGMGDRIYPFINSTEASNFMSAYFTTWGSKPETAGTSSRLGSWMLDAKALHSDVEQLKSALRTSTPAGELLIGHMVAGPGTHSPPNGIPGGSNAIGPAWRKAYAHVALPRFWTPLNETQKHSVTHRLRDEQVEALRQIAPDSGAYVNEVDPTILDWQQALYGANYARLMEVKAKWDPSGVFWCKHCVGSELWDAVGDKGIENGVGQSKVRLCRRR